MLHFERDNNCLNCRSVALIIHDDHLLIHREQTDDFWVLPGGRMEFGENSNVTVVREIKEELGLVCSVVRPLWYVENFFEYANKNHHELSTYYLVTLSPEYRLPEIGEFSGVEVTPSLIFKWVPLEELSGYNLMPSFLKTKVRVLPESIEFIFFRDNDE